MHQVDRKVEKYVGFKSTPEIKVAYMMSRFPKLTETFVLYEMLAMEHLGVQVEVYPLLREKAAVVHPEANSFIERAKYQPFISGPILRANLQMFLSRPREYLGALLALLRGTWRSFRFFVRSIVIFPKTVYFADQMAKDGVDHVHAHFASHPAAAAFVIGRLSGIPYSFTAHGSDLHLDRTMLCEKVSKAAFVVAISTYNRDIILQECGQQDSNKVLVIHCGVDTEIFQPTPENEAETSAKPYTILCIGSLHEVKGQTFLVDACRVLRDRGIEFICHLFGDGPDAMALQAQVARLGIADRVRFHGQQPRPEVVKMLQRAHVLVAPSVPSSDGRREGIPVVLMEAMASGVPVVASRLSGIPEIVEDDHTGLLTTPGDVLGLANALERIWSDGLLRQRLSKAGREKILREFDLHNNAAMLAERIRSHSST